MSTGADDDPMSSPPRSGSGPDLSRRMDNLEQNHADLDKKVDSLAGTVARVELNQAHAEELNKLRFEAMSTSIDQTRQGVGGVDAKIDKFIARIEAIISGEVRLPQAQAGDELVADYKRWRAEVDEDREQQAVLNGQVRLLGKLAVILVGTNALTIFVAIGLAVRAAMTATTGG